MGPADQRILGIFPVSLNPNTHPIVAIDWWSLTRISFRLPFLQIQNRNQFGHLLLPSAGRHRYPVHLDGVSVACQRSGYAGGECRSAESLAGPGPAARGTDGDYLRGRVHHLLPAAPRVPAMVPLESEHRARV